MLLSRQVLDRQLIDRNGHKMGRVDGVILELRQGELPRLAFIETGGDVPWRRMGRRIAGWMRAVQKRLPGSDRPTRIPWPLVRRMDIDLELDMDATGTPEMELELWLRAHVIRHIPGA
jgi:sporulation protein YlmC with PRC-barrel domain